VLTPASVPLRSLRLAKGAAIIGVVNSIANSIASIVVAVVRAVVTMGRRIVNHLCSLICKVELMLSVPRTRVSTTSSGCAGSICSGSSVNSTTSGGCANSTCSGSSVNSSTRSGNGMLASKAARRPGWKFH
jgi:hypothetical protein